MSYQMEKIRRMAAEKAMEVMEMMKDVQPELLEETEIDNEKMSDFDFEAPVDNEKITAGILEMFKCSALHGGLPSMKFELEVNDKVFKVNVELEVE